MFHVFSLRPWKRTYATAWVATACARDDVRGARHAACPPTRTRARALEERERVRALVRLHPGAVAELDERNERRDAPRRPLELRHRRGRLREARVVLEQDSAELPGELERLGARRGTRRRLRPVGSPSCNVIVLCALTWKVNSGGVRCAQWPRHLRVREVVVRRVDLDRVEPLPVVAQPRSSRRDAARIPRLEQALVGELARPEADVAGTALARPPRSTAVRLLQDRPALAAEQFARSHVRRQPQPPRSASWPQLARKVYRSPDELAMVGVGIFLVGVVVWGALTWDDPSWAYVAIGVVVLVFGLACILAPAVYAYRVSRAIRDGIVVAATTIRGARGRLPRGRLPCRTRESRPPPSSRRTWRWRAASSPARAWTSSSIRGSPGLFFIGTTPVGKAAADDVTA